MTDNRTNTKERILDVAQELIQRQGLNAMSFQDLSDAVGIRKASVHHHFPSKDLMVNALLERYLAESDEYVQGLLRSDESGKTKLSRYFGMFHETLESGEHEKSCPCGMLAAEMFSLDDKGLRLVQRFMRENVSYIQTMIQTGVTDGSLSASADVAGTADMILAALEGGLIIARCEGGPARLREITSRLLDTLSAT